MPGAVVGARFGQASVKRDGRSPAPFPSVPRLPRHQLAWMCYGRRPGVGGSSGEGAGDLLFLGGRAFCRRIPPWARLQGTGRPCPLWPLPLLDGVWPSLIKEGGREDGGAVLGWGGGEGGGTFWWPAGASKKKHQAPRRRPSPLHSPIPQLRSTPPSPSSASTVHPLPLSAPRPRCWDRKRRARVRPRPRSAPARPSFFCPPPPRTPARPCSSPRPPRPPFSSH